MNDQSKPVSLPWRRFLRFSVRGMIVVVIDAVRRTSGFVSLGLTSVLFVLALIPVPKRFESVETFVGLTILGTAVVLGASGVRMGRGIGKGGAWLSLGVLFLWVLAVFVVGGMEIVHSMAGSHR
jgi:hypothetical protein